MLIFYLSLRVRIRTGCDINLGLTFTLALALAMTGYMTHLFDGLDCFFKLLN